MNQVKVWDVPTRLFHWALVGVFVFQYVTAEWLDDAMQLHFYGGYVALGILLFRVIWGFVGSYHARFANFVHSPATAFAYANGSSQQYLGHNPLGGYSVLAILAVMLTQTISGLFMTDDIFLDGPYHGALGDVTDDIMNFLHHNAISVMYALIALHLFAIAWYSIRKKQKLIGAMVHGNKEQTDAKITDVQTHWLRFIVVVVAVSVAVYLLVEVLPPETVSDFYGF
ncbi:cytochrome b/b6 domain-containing protein [Glaciecola sp. XM2]|jgi:cytochrome b|uniref:cytochrome b/b6 domain-containing protein n=1 Tax=Glaciecola sp. XM2 TaxID=1914931 RepID=UPI001BDE5133|nr:cytochrome b/b6 domain-containing protein [Glaciecola sp. XM2]MBT1450998.1 cytochrome b/b6 domain-containing protein [Glaciecola sp. XM2]